MRRGRWGIGVTDDFKGDDQACGSVWASSLSKLLAFEKQTNKQTRLLCCSKAISVMRPVQSDGIVITVFQKMEAG